MPMRGRGEKDEKLAMKHWPQLGFKQINSEYSRRKGNSRLNNLEAKQIAEWVKSNFNFIVNAYPGEGEENLIGIITP